MDNAHCQNMDNTQAARPVSSYQRSYPPTYFRSFIRGSKTSPRNVEPCNVYCVHLENIARLGWILSCKFRPLNSQSLAAQSQC